MNNLIYTGYLWKTLIVSYLWQVLWQGPGKPPHCEVCPVRPEVWGEDQWRDVCGLPAAGAPRRQPDVRPAGDHTALFQRRLFSTGSLVLLSWHQIYMLHVLYHLYWLLYIAITNVSNSSSSWFKVSCYQNLLLSNHRCLWHDNYTAKNHFLENFSLIFLTTQTNFSFLLRKK